MKKGHPNVACAVVRFIRMCVGLKDDSITRRIVQKKVLDPIMDAFVSNGARYNLLNSCVIELVDFVRMENIKSLVSYLVSSPYEETFRAIDYVPTFQELKIRDEQNTEGLGGPEPDAGAMHEDDGQSEYKYFNEDSDDEDAKANDGLTEEEEADFLKQTEMFRMKRKTEEDQVDLLGALGGKDKRAKGEKNSASKAGGIKLGDISADTKKRRIT